MTAQFKRIEMNSVANLELAEKLVATGWKIVRSNIFAILLRKRKASK